MGADAEVTMAQLEEVASRVAFYFDRDGATVSLERWAELFCDRSYSVVGETVCDDGVLVFTAWVGMSMRLNYGAPLIFETMVSRPDGPDDWNERHLAPTLAIAQTLHAEAVARHGGPAKVGGPRQGVRVMGLYFDKQGKEISRERYSELFENPSYRVIGRTLCVNGAEVSTIWLGLNHGVGSVPELFETMTALKGETWDDCKRYGSEDEAREGHALIVARHGGAAKAGG